MFFCKDMKIQNQTRLCLAIYDFERHIMLKISKILVYAKFNSYVIAVCEFLLWFLLNYKHSYKREYCFSFKPVHLLL